MNNFKKLFPAYVMAFVLSFMLYIYEPITMYANNMDDFWFDLFMILSPLFKISISLFIIISLLFTCLYFINKIFSNKIKIYNICLIIFFICFICTYIQGNYLSSNLPRLDGDTINWNHYIKEDIISIVLWLVVIGIVVLSCLKFKIENVIKCTSFILIAIFIMLCSSFITTLTTTKNLYKKNTTSVVTDKDFDKASTNKNFFIFLLDAVDSELFDDIMSDDDDFKDTFKDFTYYKDTMSMYPFTRDSIPLVLSGKVNKNKTDFSVFSTNALDNSPLFKRLRKDNYDINLYESELRWYSEGVLKINNIRPLNRTMNETKYFKEQSKYILFKYLPYPLKRFSIIETLDFKSSKILVKANAYNYLNNYVYGKLRNSKIDKVNKKIFSYIHVEGGHVPFNNDKEINIIKNGTYRQKLEANLTLINAYLNRLKKAGVYNNSVIIIMADHGYNYDDVDGRQNPILFIKGIDEHHDMFRSKKQISYTDLMDAYMELLDDKKSSHIFSNISTKRKRKYIWYEYTKENHMVEYEQSGKAWDEDTLVKTGKEYNR